MAEARLEPRTRTLRVAGVGSKFPAASTARTEKRWLPGLKWTLVTGELQFRAGAASILQMKWAVGSLERKLNPVNTEPALALAPRRGSSKCGRGAPRISVCGGVESST